VSTEDGRGRLVERAFYIEPRDSEALSFLIITALIFFGLQMGIFLGIFLGLIPDKLSWFAFRGPF